MACRALQVAAGEEPPKGHVVLPRLLADEDLEPGAYDREKAFQDEIELYKSR